MHSEATCRDMPLPIPAPLDWSQTHVKLGTISTGRDTASVTVEMNAGMSYSQTINCTFTVSRHWRQTTWTRKQCSIGPPSVI